MCRIVDTSERSERYENRIVSLSQPFLDLFNCALGSQCQKLPELRFEKKPLRGEVMELRIDEINFLLNERINPPIERKFIE